VLVAVAAGGLVALLLAAPASAKGIERAHFTGPGLPPGGITIRGEQEGEPLSEAAVLDPKDGAKPGHFPLGPPYRATYRFDFAPGGSVRQIVYPYAEGGPWTYTPRGQELRLDRRLSLGSVQPGWHLASDGLLAFLVHEGFPSRAPGSAPPRHTAVEASPVAAEAEQTSARTGWLWGAVAAAIAAALALTALTVRRVRRTR
jgi:hypothetical protein